MRIRDENKELAIRETALKMLVEQGFDGMSMQKLATAAGVSPATLYIYYKNREDMLNQLFTHVHETFAEVALKNFSPEMSLEQGLWIQWKNRARFITEYPNYFKFFELFRNSPQIDHCKVNMAAFKQSMQLFVKNAIERKELKKMETEVFWSVAYGTFYSLMKFHVQEKSMMNKKFKVTDAIMKQTLKMVVKALKQ
ncbi:MAG: TetR/AcrR family transcriptional regulator [Bacteroidia bacterium]|nr:TetR/AcrR family transcriptional regulator [Bacteroidia bacterium]